MTIASIAQGTSDGNSMVQESIKQTEHLATQLREVPTAPVRRRLPATRASVTHKFNIGSDYKGYVTVGSYEDGRPGEVFIKMAKEGSTIGGLMDAIGILTSIALQYGVPLDVLVNKLSHTRFEPSGPTGNPGIPIAKSAVDYIFRWLGQQLGEQVDVNLAKSHLPPHSVIQSD